MNPALVELGAAIAGRIVEALARGRTPETISVADVITANERRRLRRAANVLRATVPRKPKRQRG